MTSSHASSNLQRAAPGALAFHTVWLLIACATVVEEPTSMGDVDTSAALVSTTDGSSSTTTITGNGVTHTASTSATSAVTSSTTAAATTTGGATSGEVVTSTTTSTTATTVTNTATTSSTLSSSTVSSTTASSSSAGGTGGATTGSFATTVTDGAGGSSASTTAVTNSTTGGTEYCADPLTPAEHVAAEGTTGAFDTTDGVCYKLDFVPADFAGWGCSNFQASSGNRTILVNGTSVTCGQLPLPEPVDGGYYFDFGPGTNVSAAMYWWNWE